MALAQGEREEMCHQEGVVTLEARKITPSVWSYGGYGWQRWWGAACGRNYEVGLEQERKNMAGVTWRPLPTDCFLSMCEVPSGRSEIELGEACRSLRTRARSQSWLEARGLETLKFGYLSWLCTHSLVKLGKILVILPNTFFLLAMYQ